MSTDPKRRRNRLLVAGILISSVVIAFILVRARPQPPRTSPPVRAPVVGTVPVELLEGPLLVRGSGAVRPKAEIDLSAQVAGRVAWVSPSLVSGGRVSAGQLLVRIEDADYRNAVQQARAQVAQDSVSVLEALEEAQIAEAEYEQFVERQRRRGERTTEAMEAAIEASRLTLRGPQLLAAQAALARSEAQLADAELDLTRTELRTPFSGVVRSETVDVGAYAAPGQALARLLSTEEVEVKIPLSDDDASLIPGLWGLVDAGADRLPSRVMARFGQGRYMWEGYVDRAEAALDEQTRTIDVVVRVPDPFRSGTPLDESGAPIQEADAVSEAPPLLIGQFVDVEIDGAWGEYMVVPRRSVRPGNEVWVVDSGQVRIVPVRVLQRSEGQAFVYGDIRPGERVITDGIDVATEGMAVQLREEMGS
jgi:RND family efflux transporter MFP subunit